MIEFLNTLIISQDGIYGLRVIHLIMLSVTIPFLPTAIREFKAMFIEESK